MDRSIPLRYALVDDAVVVINADGSMPVAPRVVAKLAAPLKSDLLHILIEQANEAAIRCYRRFG